MANNNNIVPIIAIAGIAAGAMVLLNKKTTATTTPGTLPAPTLSSPSDGATFQATDTVSLSWSAVQGAAMYAVKITQAQNPQISSSYNNVTATTFTVPTGVLQAGDSYQWQVASVDSNGNIGQYSAPRAFAVLISGTLITTAPVLISPANGATVNPGTIVFTWNALTNAKSYDLTIDGVTTRVTSTSPNSVIQATGTHKWTVAGVDANGKDGPYATTATFTVAAPTTQLTAPILITPSDGISIVAGTSISFSWTASSGATAYTLYVVGGGFTLPVTTAGTSFFVSPSTPGSYTWYVTPLDSAGHPGPQSAARTFTLTSTSPPPPSSNCPPLSSCPTQRFSPGQCVSYIAAEPGVPGATYTVNVKVAQLYAGGAANPQWSSLTQDWMYYLSDYTIQPQGNLMTGTGCS